LGSSHCIARASIRTRRRRATGSTRCSGPSSHRSSSSRSRAPARPTASASRRRRSVADDVASARADEEPDARGCDGGNDEREGSVRAGGDEEDVQVAAEDDRPDERDDPGCDARRVEVHGASLYGHEKGTAPEGAGPKRFAELVAVSSTTPVDFPISALADFLVRPLGAASTYSRASLGAPVNLEGNRPRYKGRAPRKARILRIFNNQHFHSTVCSLWISLVRDAAGFAGVGNPGCGSSVRPVTRHAACHARPAAVGQARGRALGFSHLT
jgi:hypothetical protein